MAFSFELHPSLLTALDTLGFQQPTPIQEQSIPLILEGKDIMAGAQTGTGKTAAFSLPVMSRLLTSDPIDHSLSTKPRVRALILTPTRELAQQVYDHIVSYNTESKLNVVVAYGGTSMGVQVKALKQGADILIATPGRLLDHAHVGTFTLANTEYLILDEADRMLDMGFTPDLRRIMRRLPAQRQTLFFSATFSDSVKKFAYDLLNDPVCLDVSPVNSAAETVTQMVYPVDKMRKSELLAYLIGVRNWQQVLVFVKTKQATDALVSELKLDGLKAVSIHGDKSQGARQRALDEFKSGQKRVLIATDVAARGIDIQQLECVVNYDFPFKAEDYVHRIGRTGRAGQAGIAISLLSHDEEPMLRAIETLIDDRLPQEWLEGFEPSLVVPQEGERRRGGRGSEKRRTKAKLNIHRNRGKKA